ncbi:MAG: GNAT family N-acetyltransferase [Pseudomonadales bacterium]|nr:GNAT family N-acetyltransferase [Pseudomonadales bacterium]
MSGTIYTCPYTSPTNHYSLLRFISMTDSVLTSAAIPAAHQIITANNSDGTQVAAILGSAFTHDPLLNWLTPYTPLYSSLFLAEIDALYKKHGHIYINKDQSGAAIWLPAGVPTKVPFGFRMLTTVFQLVIKSGLGSLKRILELEKVFAENRPREAHFYLHAIGSSLENQGKGIGSALLKAGLAECDKVGMPAYLESSNQRNNPLYQRYGFEIIGEATFSNNGPTIWFMRREANNRSH